MQELRSNAVKNGRSRQTRPFKDTEADIQTSTKNRASRGSTMYRGQQVTWRDQKAFVGRHDTSEPAFSRYTVLARE